MCIYLTTSISGLLNWQTNLQDKRFLSTACAIIALGTLSASIGVKPLSLIMLAQTANAMLLPISALLLVWVCNKKAVMQEHTNSVFNNFAGLLVVVSVVTISAYKLFS